MEMVSRLAALGHVGRICLISIAASEAPACSKNGCAPVARPFTIYHLPSTIFCKHETSPHARADTPSCCSTPRPPSAGSAVDPVCGMTHRSGDAAGEHDYQGPDLLLLQPRLSREVQGRSREVPRTAYRPRDRSPPAPAGTSYICPMDPEVRQDHPGACPKCGMALEPDLSTMPADAGRIHLPDASGDRARRARARARSAAWRSSRGRSRSTRRRTPSSST